MVSEALAIYNVQDYGASGKKEDNAQVAINIAIEACAAAGGGTVYFPPGGYTTGTIHLRSHVCILVEAGATIFSSKDPAAFDQRALFYAEDLENVTLEGRGTVNGQAEYEWRMNDMRDWYIYPNQVQAEAAGVPLMRAFPTANSIGHLVLFIRCTDVRITELSFIDSPSWTMHLWGCERLVIDGVYISTNLKAGVWADGIDPDGCKDVHITNCTVQTGDDSLVFYSSNIYGPARPCENITVTNCRLTSSSSGIKFCDGNQKAIRNVVIDNCTITGANRGLAFMVFDGGVLENVVLSNLTIECVRYDWFWWGDGDPIHFNLIKRSEIDANMDKSKEPPIGIIRNVIVSDVIARGYGTNLIHGNVDSPLEDVTLENVRLTVAYDPNGSPRKMEHAVVVENARNLRLKDFEINWEQPFSDKWQSALTFQNVQGLLLDGVSARQAPNGTRAPAILFNDVDGAVIRDCQAQQGTGIFLHFKGAGTKNIFLHRNDTHHAKKVFDLGKKVAKDAVQA
jgi:polygalacturonase